MTVLGFDHTAEIKEYWNTTLTRFPKSSLVPFDFTLEDLTFLSEVGLPDLGKGKFGFHTNSTKFESLICEDRNHVVLGYFGHSPLGVEVKTRRVFLLNNQCERNFLNSNLESLLLFLIRNDKLYYKVPNNGWWGVAEFNSAVDEITQQLLRIDPAAIAKESTFWSRILLEMRFGLV